jgi:hypothetical protein
MADLVLERVGAALTGASVQTLFHLLATNERGAALLRMWCDPEDPPSIGRDGRTFIVLPEGQLKEVLRRAELAGLTVQLPGWRMWS